MSCSDENNNRKYIATDRKVLKRILGAKLIFNNPPIELMIIKSEQIAGRGGFVKCRK